MSVLVKGLKMPENCNKCPMESLELYDSRFGFANGFYKCAVLNQSVEDVMYHGRLSGCPLVDFGKYGRLADALIEDVDGDLTDSIAEGRAIEKIMEARTVIEAEDSDVDVKS